MTPEDQKNLLKSIGLFVAERVKPLEARIAEMEAKQNEFRYVGVWAVGKYHEGNFVTHDGSLWHCNQETERKPGQDSAWTLCCKRGQDGNRAPTASRSYAARALATRSMNCCSRSYVCACATNVSRWQTAA